jgi:hypothetical protein
MCVKQAGLAQERMSWKALGAAERGKGFIAGEARPIS